MALEKFGILTRMRVTFLVLLFAALAACQRAETPSAAAPSPARTSAAAPSVVAPPPAVPEGPAPQPSPLATAADDESDDDNVPMGPEYEIDADADRYFTYPLATVMFDARPLNGEPPFTYTWDFADGSPQESGPRVEHRFDNIGNYHVLVKSKDKSGEMSHVELIIDVVSREDWARVKGVDPATLPSPVPTP